MPHPTALADALVASLRALRLSGRRVAIVGYPSHDNVGDHAIWCGQLAVLQRLDCAVVASVDTQEYSPRVLRRRLGRNGVVLFQGGGSFGDLWPEHHELRLRVLNDFARHQIVQLPQTLHFRSSEILSGSSAAIAPTRRFTILCRDESSLSVARDDLNAEAQLAPDAAFGLAPLARIERPQDADVLWLRRLDDERTTEPLLPPEGALAGRRVRVIDWRDLHVPAPGPARLTQKHWRANQLRAARFTRQPGIGDLTQPLLRRLHDGASRRELEAGLAAITRSRVLVTDRLHAHILATLAGVPSVVVDTGYGKLDTFIDAFTADLATTHRARSGTEAAALADALLTDTKQSIARAPGF